MYVEQIYTGCLAEAAYYIESNGEAAVVDPLRDTDAYLKMLETRGTKLKYIFETHFHADFVSGHLDLARKTGAKIVFGSEAVTEYETIKLKDGERLTLGELVIECMHTPGHTPECVCYLLYKNKSEKIPHAIFTGDTLFNGDVGRPDLLGANMPAEVLAGIMYETIQKKILPLEDSIILYPGHGPGSPCGKAMSKETVSTIGHQKKFNYALQPMTKKEFIHAVTDGMLPPPKYFSRDAVINRKGYSSLEEIISRSMKPLSLKEFDALSSKVALILDTRNPNVFEQGFIPNSMSIGLSGQYAMWAGTLLDLEQEIVIVCEAGKEYESIMRLARVGFENVRGYLEGGIETWNNAERKLETITRIPAQEFEKQWREKHYEVLDVRNRNEFRNERLSFSKNLSLQDLTNNLNSLDKNKTYFVHCAGGYRSTIASSIMRKHGIKNLIDVHGGFGAIKTTRLKIESGEKVLQA